MTIAYAGSGYCVGCEEPVLVYMDGQREQVRDTETGERPWHLHRCVDRSKRERVEMSVENILAFCPDCSCSGVGVSTWGRLVECPYPSWMSVEWDEPYQRHVCGDAKTRGTLKGMPAVKRAPSKQPAVHAVDVPEL